MIENKLRAARQAAGWSQSELAAQAGTTWQTIGALEAGLYAPTLGVALRLARVLGCEVGVLFWLADDHPTVQAELLPSATGEAVPRRVQVARVGARTLARPLDACSAADGLLAAVVRGERTGELVTVALLLDPVALDRTALVLGCDPALGTLGAHLQRRHGHHGLRLATSHASRLAALARGEAHAAGMHLRDAATGEYNLPFVRRAFAGRRVLVVTAMHWAQGLIVARGNPLGLAGVADLARPEVAIVNREEGAGSRAALDQALQAAGLAPALVRGYGRLVGSHHAVAEAVAAGLSAAGPGILAAARARGLAFIPLAEERYDLVFADETSESAPVAALLDTLTSRPFRDDIDALPGYDVARTGAVVLDALLPLDA